MVKSIRHRHANLHANALLQRDTLEQGQRNYLFSRPNNGSNLFIAKTSDVIGRNRKRGRVNPLSPRLIRVGRDSRHRIGPPVGIEHVETRSRWVIWRQDRHERPGLDSNDTCQLPSANNAIYYVARIGSEPLALSDGKFVQESSNKPVTVNICSIPVIK